MKLSHDEEMVVNAMRLGADVDIYFHTTQHKLSVVEAMELLKGLRPIDARLVGTELETDVAVSMYGPNAVDISAFVSK